MKTNSGSSLTQTIKIIRLLIYEMFSYQFNLTNNLDWHHL